MRNHKNKLNIALSRGRVFDEEIELLRKAGFELRFGERELSAKVEDKTFWFIKPQDVPVWVESGVADLGMVGLDIIREKRYDVLELLDLGIGKCRFSLASPKEKSDIEELKNGKVVIATKFPNLTKKFAEKIFPDFSVIELKGSVEIAPHVGLSDIIADLVSTGKTLKENDLVEIKKLAEFSTYLICNRTSFVLKYKEIEEFLLKIASASGKKISFLEGN